jgi:hypothetical protein
VCLADPEAKLAIVLERTAADRNIFTSECGTACIGIFEDTIINSQMTAGEFDCATLGTVGGVSKANAFYDNVITLDSENCIADGRLDHRFAAADVLIIVAPDIETFAIQIDVESASGELATFEDLTECITVDKNLLAPAD